jgi:hypothetical protein
VSRAAQQSGEARRNQASALWRPIVMLKGTAGVGGSDMAVDGARFSAPGFGTSDGVAFNTSVNRGTLGRLALSASLPLISRERDAQGKKLVVSAEELRLLRRQQVAAWRIEASMQRSVSMCGEPSAVRWRWPSSDQTLKAVCCLVCRR